jgi:hypothetical protein
VRRKMLKKVMIVFGIFSTVLLSNNLEYSNAIEKAYSKEDILEVKKYCFENINYVSDIYLDNDLFYISGSNFSGSFMLNKISEKIENEQKIENFDYNFRSIDKIDNEISLLDNKRRILVQKRSKFYIDYKLEDITGFSYDGDRIWIYDAQEKKVFLFKIDKENKKLDAISCINYKGEFEIKGLRIKSNKELWACSENRIFIFDEYFKFRHVYELNENISGFCFADNEDEVNTVIVYASAAKNGELYRYKLKRY